LALFYLKNLYRNLVYYAHGMKNKNNIYLGMFLLGMTGVLIGVVLESVTASLIAGALGTIIGGFVGWLGGRRYLIIICLGAVVGAGLGYQAGDKDILIMAAGSGAAISGFIANFIEMFRKKPK
jgi:hypothetical protein